MRDYKYIDQYLDQLNKDIYPQPEDEAHDAWALDALQMLSDYKDDIRHVLDVGCGEGFCKPLFKNIGIEWFGVTLGASDYKKAKEKSEKDETRYGDMHFMTFVDSASIDMVFARHVLEHSPMPLLALMEWNRISKKYLFLIAPAPEYWQYWGKNHYAMMNKDQLWWLLARAGWRIIEEQDFTTSHQLYMKYFMPEQPPEDRTYHGPPDIVEYRYLCVKAEPRTE